MARAPLRVGLVGANSERGWATHSHVPALQALPMFEIAGIAARSRALAEKAAPAYGNARCYEDAYDLIASPDIDVVTVSVKVPEHLPIVLAGLESGKHMFCEWPLGRNVAEAETMAAAAAKARGRVIIGCQGTGAPAIRRAAEIAASGALGALRTARVISPSAGWEPEAASPYIYLNQHVNGANMLSIPGGHTLACVLMTLGPYAELQAQTTIQHRRIPITDTGETIERDTPDHLALIGRHANGCVSTVEVIAGHPPRIPFLFGVSGDRGELKVTSFAEGAFQTGQSDLETDLDVAPPPPPVVAGLVGPAMNVAEIYAQLAETIRTGEQQGCDFEFAATLTRLLAAVKHSADTGRRVRLDEKGREISA
ncbi:MAG: Gfo/Idh/MocA family oxidoreductase [Caulobacteraceae bacterium]|nr:Gfo/Idh/MocA family oxidoreductase [Caulobacteraceae bacterium]